MDVDPNRVQPVVARFVDDDGDPVDDQLVVFPSRIQLSVTEGLASM